MDDARARLLQAVDKYGHAQPTPAPAVLEALLTLNLKSDDRLLGHFAPAFLDLKKRLGPERWRAELPPELLCKCPGLLWLCLHADKDVRVPSMRILRDLRRPCPPPSSSSSSSSSLPLATEPPPLSAALRAVLRGLAEESRLQGLGAGKSPQVSRRELGFLPRQKSG